MGHPTYISGDGGSGILSDHFATVGACPCAQRSALVATPVARRGGDHGIDVDELTVREERGEGKKRGAPWGPEVSSCHCLPWLARRWS